jgi:hypothetical protein
VPLPMSCSKKFGAAKPPVEVVENDRRIQAKQWPSGSLVSADGIVEPFIGFGADSFDVGGAALG